MSEFARISLSAPFNVRVRPQYHFNAIRSVSVICVVTNLSTADSTCFNINKNGVPLEAPWLGGRMPDSGSREPGFESSTYYDGAVDGDTLWRQQNKILLIVLGNKL